MGYAGNYAIIQVCFLASTLLSTTIIRANPICIRPSDGPCTLCPRVYDLLMYNPDIPNLFIGWLPELTSFKDQYITLRNVNYIDYPTGCSQPGPQADPQTAVNKLSLMVNELQNMTWWSRQIELDVQGTFLSSKARDLRHDHHDRLRVLNQELSAMSNIAACNDATRVSSRWGVDDMCMDYQVNQPSNPTSVQLIHAMMRMEELITRFYHVQPRGH